MLLASDATLPSVATLVAGGPVRGSWWAHPKSHAIFAAITALSRDPHVLSVPLVAGKVTFVHRDLWPALLTVALAREPWQTRKLSAAARRLLEKVRKAGEIEASGDAAREVERRLLTRGEQFHTDQGSHARRLERWERWAARTNVKPLNDVARAKDIIERAVAKLSAAKTNRSLPWPRSSNP